MLCSSDEEVATQKVILFWNSSISMPMEFGFGYMKRSKNG